MPSYIGPRHVFDFAGRDTRHPAADHVDKVISVAVLVAVKIAAADRFPKSV
jgi:hypothetical protein